MLGVGVLLLPDKKLVGDDVMYDPLVETVGKFVAAEYGDAVIDGTREVGFGPSPVLVRDMSREKEKKDVIDCKKIKKPDF